MNPKERDSSEPRLFHESVLEFLRVLPAVEKRFWFLVFATGLIAGLGAVALVGIQDAVRTLAWPAATTVLDAAEHASPGRRMGALVCAGLLVAGASLALKRPLGGHGTAGVLEAIWLTGGRYSLSRALVNGTLAVVVVALGVPLGREGALIAWGGGAGAFLSARLDLGDVQRRVLVACGASAGIAAAYNVPIGAAVFGLEVLLGSFALELLGPIVVACVTATLVSRGLVTGLPAYQIPLYSLGAPAVVLRFLVLAPFLGIASALYVRVIEAGAALGERTPERWKVALPVAACAVIGLVSWWFPQVLGNGYDTVNAALLGSVAPLMLLVLPFTKAGLTSLASGVGMPGGLFTPSLFFGALLGGAAGVALEAVWPGHLPLGAYALVGMAAVLAGTTHAVLSSVLIIFEMTRDYGGVLPLLVACVASVAVSRRILPDSLYTGVLRRRKLVLPGTPRPAWAVEGLLSALVRQDAARVAPGDRFEEVLVRLLQLPPGNDLYVVDEEGRLRGAVVLDLLKGHLPDRALLGAAIALDVASQVPMLTLDSSLADAARMLAATWLDKLPVVDPDGRFLGVVSKQDVFARGLF